MKKILVLTETQTEALRNAWELTMMLENNAEIKSYSHKSATVRTDNVSVTFISKRCQIDGLSCDVPVGFGKHGKIMTKERSYPELNSLKEIAKYIIEEETK